MAAGALHELQRQHAHAHQVRAVDALEGLDDDRLHAEQTRALGGPRSEEHTSELQSLMRNSSAVLCLKKNNKRTDIEHAHTTDDQTPSKPRHISMKESAM